MKKKKQIKIRFPLIICNVGEGKSYYAWEPILEASKALKRNQKKRLKLVKLLTAEDRALYEAAWGRYMKLQSKGRKVL